MAKFVDAISKASTAKFIQHGTYLMQTRGAYGATMAEYFGAQRAPIQTRSHHMMTGIAVTHLRCDAPGSGFTEPIPRERALIVAYQFRPLTMHRLWFGGQIQKVQPYARGAVSTVNLDHEPSAYIGSSFETLQFYLPQSALNRIADMQGTNAISELTIQHGTLDPVIGQLAMMARYLSTKPEQASNVLLDAMILTLHARLAQRYSVVAVKDSVRPGRLAPWQEKRVKEMIESRLDGSLTLTEMAVECGLSPSHFARAFKQTTGEPPHRWLVQRRIARAQHLMLNSSLMLSQIALACGYADQSHLTKAFKSSMGLSPGAWRREKATT